MCLWPSTTPGSVSTSRSRNVSFCFCAKLRTCAWANLMSSRSRFFIVPMARSISCGVSLNDGDVLARIDVGENLLDRLAPLGVGRLDRARVHSALAVAGHDWLLYHPPL